VFLPSGQPLPGAPVATPRITNLNGVDHRIQGLKQMKSNVKLSLSKLRPEALLALTRNVVAKMTGNTNFTTPAVALATLTAQGNALETAIKDATFGSRQSKLVRNQQVALVSDSLRTQADYVRSVCVGDPVKLGSSGFELEKKREPVGIPGSTKRMEARITNLRGELELRWKTVHGAHGYQVWMTDQDPATSKNWQAIGFTTRVSHLVTDLESYKAYWFCVSSIGVAGEGEQSSPAMGRAA
jgi:hypothetical protein